MNFPRRMFSTVLLGGSLLMPGFVRGEETVKPVPPQPPAPPVAPLPPQTATPAVAPIASQTPAPVPPVPSANPLTAEQVAELVKDLGSDDYKARSEAEKKLRTAGPEALPELEKATSSNDPEIKSRASKILGGLRAAPVLQKMSDVYAQTPSMESDLEIKMFMRGMEATMAGHLKSLTDGKKFTMSLGMTLQGMQMFTKSTGDGTYMWNEMSMAPQGGGPPVPRMVQKIPLAFIEKVGGSDGQTNPLQALKDLREKYNFNAYSEGKLGDLDCFIIEGTMKQEALDKRVKAIEEVNGAEAAKTARVQFSQMSRTRLYVNKKDYLTYRNELLDEAGTVVLVMDIKNIQLGNTFEPSTFQYTPPPGVQVMDIEKLQKDAMQMQKVKQAMSEDDPDPKAPKTPTPPPSLKRPEGK